MNWETAKTPCGGARRGYALVRVGRARLGEIARPIGAQLAPGALDYYDAVEWSREAAVVLGSIGTLGISYHASSNNGGSPISSHPRSRRFPWKAAPTSIRDPGLSRRHFRQSASSRPAFDEPRHLLGKPRSYNPTLH